MQARAAQTKQTQPETLNCCKLIVDGNGHRNDLLLADLPENQGTLFCEAMLPQIRTYAIMIAATRLNADKNTPAIITDEADWFAARILVLQARIFHLDISLKPMLKTANKRAEAFAQQHNLPFTSARMHMSVVSAFVCLGFILSQAFLIWWHRWLSATPGMCSDLVTLGLMVLLIAIWVPSSM